MLFSRNWIGSFVELPDDQALAEGLTAAGLAVEGQEPVGDDVVFDLDVTTNRPDAMNHLGLAREVSVLFERPMTTPHGTEVTEGRAASAAARLTVEDADLCPRFVGLVIRGVRVGPSPDWLVARLEAIGARPINNVVDVTNYALWSVGQPMHAYDLGKLGGQELRVRRARDGETLTTLDGEKRTLDASFLVIADADVPVGLAGIMGGLDSEVTETTTDVLLEAAHFHPQTVRRGAKKLGMHTDASHRFERGADPDACLWAARWAAGLIAELAGGTVLAGHLESHQPRAAWPPTITVEHAKLERFGGIDVTPDTVERILTGLGFELEAIEADSGPAWQVTPPSWRYYDFENPYPADVYEEVLRIIGLDAVPATLPPVGGPDAPARPEFELRRQARGHLAACGFAEAIDYGFLDRERDAAYPSLLTLDGDREPLPLANPLSDRYAVMRRSVLPDLVASARYNQRRGAVAVRLFEVGHVFAEGSKDGQSAAHPHVLEGVPVTEMETIGLVLGGVLGTPWERPVPYDFFDLKGVVESLARATGVELNTVPASLPRMVAGTGALFVRVDNGVRVGLTGELDEDDRGYPLFVAELTLRGLLTSRDNLDVEPPPRLPGISVDTTLTHDLSITWAEIADTIETQAVPDLARFALKDRYQGKGVPAGAVNTTMTFHYNAGDRSLTQDEVNERHQALAAELERRFGWQQSGGAGQ